MCNIQDDYDCIFLSFNISENKHVMKNLTTNAIVFIKGFLSISLKIFFYKNNRKKQ